MQSGKAQVQEAGVHAANDRSKTNLNFQHMNKPAQISPNDILQS